MTITFLTTQHIDQVARLHCETLSGLLSELGQPAARAFYTGCFKSESAKILIHLEQGVVRGFVMGSTHPNRIKQEVIKHNPIGTSAGLCIGILQHPATLAYLIKSFKGPDEGQYDPRAAELTYLAVAPEDRKRGIGRQLVDAFTSTMHDAGLSTYELSVDEENYQARRFYEHYGFVLIGTYREFGKVHRRYRLQLRKSN